MLFSSFIQSEYALVSHSLFCSSAVDIWTQVDPSTQQGSATFFKYLSLLHPVSFYTYVWKCKHVLMLICGGGGWDRPAPPPLFNGVLNLINRKCKGGSTARIFFYSLKKLKYTMQMSMKRSLCLKKYTANRFSSRRVYYSYAICMFSLP